MDMDCDAMNKKEALLQAVNRITTDLYDARDVLCALEIVSEIAGKMIKSGELGINKEKDNEHLVLGPNFVERKGR